MTRIRSIVGFVALGVAVGVVWQLAPGLDEESSAPGTDLVVEGTGPSSEATLAAPVVEPQAVLDSAAFSFSPLLKLDEVHQRVLDEGLSVARATVVNTDVKDGSAGVVLSIGDPIWEATESAGLTLSPGTEVDVSTGPVGESTIALLEALKPDTEVVAVIAKDGELLAIAELGGDTGVVKPADPSTTGPFFLGLAANELLTTGYVPVPVQPGCPPAEGDQPRIFLDALDALTQYFVALGDETRSQRVAVTEEMVAIADTIALENATLRDPVLGEFIAPSLNDLEHQLASGVAVEELVIRPAIPVGVTVPADGRPSDIVEFRSAGSGRLLGWMSLSPTRSGNTEFIIEIAPPDNKEDLAILIGSLDDPLVFCDADDGGDVVMSIEYDRWAGSKRANIDIGTARATPLHSLDLDE